MLREFKSLPTKASSSAGGMSVSNLHFALFEAVGFEITKLRKLENTCLWEPGSVLISLPSERETSTEILVTELMVRTEVFFFM